MILEYLFSDPKSVQKNIRTYAEKNASVAIEIKDVKESEVWLVSVKVNLENNQSALTLSKINEQITGTYNVVTLTNEAAAYYNKMLYPLINKFERDLRKLLYLASTLSENSSDSEAIKDLEKMDFGTLFDLIFTDEKFIKSVKTTINAKNWNYSKAEIVNYLKDLEENTLWKKLLSAEIAPMLQKNYITIKNYRNNVMHAHNITSEDYLNAKHIYSTVTAELENAIENIINNKINFNDIQNFNSAILEAINNEKRNNLIAASDAYNEKLINILDTPDMIAFRNQIMHLSDITNTSDMIALKEQLSNITNTPEMIAFRNQIKHLNNIRKQSE